MRQAIMKSFLARLAVRPNYATLIALFTALVILPANFANAVEIQTVKSPGGITALLVENYTVPLIAVSMAFTGGATQEASDKEGLANILSSLLDEGAGDIKSQEFQLKLDELGVELGFSAGYDSFTGRLKTLRSTRTEAFDMLRLALTKPRFDSEPIERMRAAQLSVLQNSLKKPSVIAGKAWRKSVFGDHPYARSVGGTIKSIKAINRKDIASLHKKLLAKDNLVVGVVGAISAKELSKMLDHVFGDLPDKAELKPISEAELAIGGIQKIELDLPQSIIRVVFNGLKRENKDFYAAYLMNYILGGGSFSSRLYEEIREKRGLAYGVYTYLGTQDHAGFIGGGTATRADRADETIKILLAEVERMAKDGPTVEELEKAKKYITGSYAISNLDTSGKIASVMVAIQRENLGVDYIDKRADYIAAVTIEDTKRMARELLSAKPTIVIVGPNKS
jgi:zinc protease